MGRTWLAVGNTKKRRRGTVWRSLLRLLRNQCFTLTQARPELAQTKGPGTILC